VARWTREQSFKRWGQVGKSILDMDLIVIPVHQVVHWVVATIDMREREVVYYDSLKRTDDNLLEHLVRQVPALQFLGYNLGFLV
jgi:sentrin-specific protease 1